MIQDFKGKRPYIHESCFIAPTADIIGDVTVGENSSVWHRAVLRGDINSIKIGANSNIQDGTVIHVADGHPVTIGNNVTVGHNAILHGCTIKDNALIGMGAIVLDGAVVGEGALVGAGSLVPEGREIPPYSLAVGIPAKVVRELTAEQIDKIKKNTEGYVELAKAYIQE
ncbi:gamma carbonic anhydrase family protein [Thermosediminibacter litoriperuensis]|uniref:Carbonic anhydrase/acetyltransferase-like protein (Isoleucine patch superfamily) n=1 Tax=Thermosediminibacter litoriperuensis TaxID=291989 RepID=A0A5S5AUH9_9FIRM|nr:gamma carbonic anhydrase family protein [Thermosediminibacter litoriperuensis]TYP56101.1 carbonic anhydrase/acetyltransferase-like protein (isoleucine patch superfamily) [Thermosediminibacter litoriperuensis]